MGKGCLWLLLKPTTWGEQWYWSHPCNANGMGLLYLHLFPEPKMGSGVWYEFQTSEVTFQITPSELQIHLRWWYMYSQFVFLWPLLSANNLTKWVCRHHSCTDLRHSPCPIRSHFVAHYVSICDILIQSIIHVSMSNFPSYLAPLSFC